MKRMIAIASLQRPFENQTLTPQNMYTFCKEKFGVKISSFILLVIKQRKKNFWQPDSKMLY